MVLTKNRLEAMFWERIGGERYVEGIDRSRISTIIELAVDVAREGNLFLSSDHIAVGIYERGVARGWFSSPGTSGVVGIDPLALLLIKIVLTIILFLLDRWAEEGGETRGQGRGSRSRRWGTGERRVAV